MGFTSIKGTYVGHDGRMFTTVCRFPLRNRALSAAESAKCQGKMSVLIISEHQAKESAIRNFLSPPMSTVRRERWIGGSRFQTSTSSGVRLWLFIFLILDLLAAFFPFFPCLRQEAVRIRTINSIVASREIRRLPPPRKPNESNHIKFTKSRRG